MQAQETPSNQPIQNLTPTPEKKPEGESVVSFLRSIAVIVFVVFVLIRPTLMQNYVIPSSSMVPTLQIGDQILVSKLSYGIRLFGLTNAVYQWSLPKRGSVVVFTRPDDPASPEDDSQNYFIKRVIGLPGETVELRGTKIFINGTELDEPYARYDLGGVPDGNFAARKIPEGHIFLLGDNRDHSKDSRFWTESFLDVRRVHGKALVIYWSTGAQFWSRILKLIR